MAPNRNIRSRTFINSYIPKQDANRRTRRRKKKQRKSSNRSTSFGGYIATGIRTLTNFLPGQKVIRPVVDTILRAIGLVSALEVTANGIEASTQVIGLSSRKALYYGDLLCNCKNFGLQDIDDKGCSNLKLNFLTGRILSVTPTVEPTGEISGRSGEWAVALVPLKDSATKGKEFLI